jgi:uncharacterized protein (DUF1499 family)
MISTTALAAAGLAAGIAAIVWGVGLERVWTAFGPADLGPVAFETLQRRTTPNDALACPPDICRAPADLAAPVFAVSAAELRQAFGRVIASEPDVTQAGSGVLGERYIQRSRWLRFPDTIEVRYIARGEARSTIALYSRSQLGRGDLGVNRARIARWLEKLAREAPVAE